MKNISLSWVTHDFMKYTTSSAFSGVRFTIAAYHLDGLFACMYINTIE